MKPYTSWTCFKVCAFEKKCYFFKGYMNEVISFSKVKVNE